MLWRKNFRATQGLKKEDILRHNCRIKSEEFCSGLFADDGLMVGRVDSRFTGPVTSGSLEDGDSDPSTSALDSIFTSVMNQYFTDELGLQTDRPYILVSDPVNDSWTWVGENHFLKQEKIMYESISKNKFLKVWEVCGYYDLATPFFANEWIINHLFLDDEHKAQVHFSHYASGHMFYLNKESQAAFHEEAESWYAE